MATHSTILPWRIPIYREAWQASVQRVANSWTRLRLRNKAIQRRTRGLRRGSCCPQAFLTFFLSLVCLGVIHYHLPLIDMHIQFRAGMRQDFLVVFVTFA